MQNVNSKFNITMYASKLDAKKKNSDISNAVSGGIHLLMS